MSKLRICRIELQNDEVSDTTTDDSSNADDNQTKLMIKKGPLNSGPRTLS